MNSQNKFTVISTFSGCGGSSLGYQLAGGKVLLAVEMDNNAVQTYKLNFPDTPIYHGDIHNLTSDEILRRCNLKPGELDILDGSPPCQGFSDVGKREFCDPRNQLYKEYIRLIQGLQPKCFVMENVKGLVKGKRKLIFKDILKELKSCGYRVKVRLMNSMYYGVPQSRERLIFIGIRNDLELEPSHPSPQTKPISVKKALVGVKNKTYPPEHNVIKNIAKFIPPGGKASTSLTPQQIRQYYPKLEEYIKKDCNLDNRVKRLHPDKPIPTIIRMFIPCSIGIFLHFKEDRYLTIEELKRCSSFPDDFNFIGDYKTQHARIGNSVPPLLMKAIASHIYKNILSELT